MDGVRDRVAHLSWNFVDVVDYSTCWWTVTVTLVVHCNKEGCERRQRVSGWSGQLRSPFPWPSCLLSWSKGWGGCALCGG